MGWSPGEFWRATYFDFTALIWQRMQATKPKSREMSQSEVVAMFKARAQQG